MQSGEIRLAVDIGGTFTDVALESGISLHTAKTLTTYGAPERGVLTGVRDVLQRAGLEPQAVTTIIYGTTLATNLLIEHQQFPETCKIQHSSGIPTCAFVNRHVKIGLS